MKFRLKVGPVCSLFSLLRLLAMVLGTSLLLPPFSKPSCTSCEAVNSKLFRLEMKRIDAPEGLSYFSRPHCGQRAL